MIQANHKEALYVLSPDCDREQWVRIAMAFKAAGGDFETFDAWSANAPARYDKSNCRRTWDGIQPTGGITGATLYGLAKSAGYIFPTGEQMPRETPRNAVQSAPVRRIAAVYQYKDKAGRLRALNIRYEPKDFRPRYAVIENPDPAAFDDLAQWARKKPDGFVMPLYHEDEIARRSGDLLYMTEGEKDADALAQLGYLTTCHKAGGAVVHAGRGIFKGRRAVIIADADEAGRKYAEEAGKNLSGEAASVAIITPPDGFKDYSDWEEAQDSAESVEALRERFETWGIPASERDTCETLAAVWNDPPPRSPEIVGGLLRQGHKMILSGSSKAGKSFALLQLAAALCEGREWLQTFPCKASRILYLNLEVDRASMIHRALKVYHALDWTPRGLENFIFDHMRGRTADIDVMAADIVAKARKHGVGVIFIDPVYKCGLADENAAGDIAKFCRVLDRIAADTGAAVIYCHHYSKGEQSGKAAIDRAAGSGVFARDADAILALSGLAEPDAYRLECILREFKSPPPLPLRFEYPLHIPAPELEGCPLKGARGERILQAKQESEDKARRKVNARSMQLEQVEEIARHQKAPMQKTPFVETVMGRLAIGKDAARALVAALLDDGRLVETAQPENNNRKLITAPAVMEQKELI